MQKLTQSAISGENPDGVQPSAQGRVVRVDGKPEIFIPQLREQDQVIEICVADIALGDARVFGVYDTVVQCFIGYVHTDDLTFESDEHREQWAVEVTRILQLHEAMMRENYPPPGVEGKQWPAVPALDTIEAGIAILQDY